ncbi:MAG: hypothetical protein WBG69_07450 [Arcobacteraceae bacterium]
MAKSKKNQKKSSLLPLFLISILSGVAIYYAFNQAPSEETYRIKSAGGEDGYKASFINLTGPDAQDKKIKLSDDYWEGGKFK